MTALFITACCVIAFAWLLTGLSYAIQHAAERKVARMVAAWEQREANADRLADYLAHTDDALDLDRPYDFYGDRFDTTARWIAALDEIQEHR